MKKLEVALQGQDGGRNDRKWFPFWLRKYAALCGQETGQPPAVEQELVIAFLHRLREDGRSGWQRDGAGGAVRLLQEPLFSAEGSRPPASVLAPRRRKMGASQVVCTMLRTPSVMHPADPFRTRQNGYVSVPALLKLSTC